MTQARNEAEAIARTITWQRRVAGLCVAVAVMMGLTSFSGGPDGYRLEYAVLAAALFLGGIQLLCNAATREDGQRHRRGE